MNLGLPEELKVSFPGTSTVERPRVSTKIKLDPYWLAGFVEAEGCFLVEVGAHKTHKSSYQVKLNFSISQHIRDTLLIESLIKFLGCGYIVNRPDREIAEYRVVSLNDTTGKIIPFFQMYPLQGSKQIDFEAYCKVADLMKNKAHLTAEGLKEIQVIKLGMSRGRSTFV